jgi:uncharacterized protein YyaL (SSP411 family)
VSPTVSLIFSLTVCPPHRYLLDPAFVQYLEPIIDVWRQMDDAVGGAAAVVQRCKSRTS